MIEFKGVKYTVRNMDIINDISFKIEKNTTTAFIGGKNSGKTSLIKLMSGVYKNYYGEILIDGKDIQSNSDTKIDVVHEKREKNTNLTVIEYLEFYARIYGRVTDKAYEEYIDEMLKRFSLISYKYTLVEDIDNETFKLVDIIRVMIGDTDIIIFDNLFFSDNHIYNDRLKEFLMTILGKKTIVFFSRSLDHIEEFCDHIGVLDAGNLIAFDEKESLYRKAELNRKVQVNFLGDTEYVISILKNNSHVSNIIYDNNVVTFAISDVDIYKGTSDTESDILRELIDKGIKVYSFKKEQIKLEQLLGKLRD